MSGTGMAGVKCAFTFNLEPTGDRAARFTLSGDFEGALIKGALGKAVEKDGAKQLDKTLAQLTGLAVAHTRVLESAEQAKDRPNAAVISTASGRAPRFPTPVRPITARPRRRSRR